MLRVSRTLLCAVYAAIAVLALCATWHQNLFYFQSGDPLTGTVRFWKETVATPAATSINIDLFLLALAAALWMVLEARRLGIRWVWGYIVLGALIAISVTFPLFLIARERRLRVVGATAEEVGLTQGDLIALLVFAGPSIAISAWSLLN